MPRVLLPVLALLCCSSAARAQIARVATADTLRAAPGGDRLATLQRGATLRVGAPRAGWRAATLEGWVPDSAVSAQPGGVAGLVVRERDGVDARAVQGGAPIAHVPGGVFLELLERRGHQLRVRRGGWVRAGGLVDLPPAPQDTGSAAAAAAATPAGTGGGTPSPAAATAGYARAGETGAPVLGHPGADTVARLAPLAQVEVLAREGAWTRVRVEGWVSSGALAAPTDSGGVLMDVSGVAVRENPEAYRGRLVLWPVQFLALEHAEKIRTDFPEGAPFLLTRGPGAETGFVYVGVPAALLDRVKRLEPLQRIRILGRVREGRSPLMGGPVLDLVEVRP